LVIEPNGYLASNEKVLLAIARGGDAVSVFWNVNAVMQVMVVKAGKVVRTFDPLLGDGEGSPLPEEDGLPFGTDDESQPASLEFLRRMTGVVANEELVLKSSRPTYTVVVKLPWNAVGGGPVLKSPPSL
jgi:hypothetical protein